MIFHIPCQAVFMTFFFNKSTVMTGLAVDRVEYVLLWKTQFSVHTYQICEANYKPGL